MFLQRTLRFLRQRNLRGKRRDEAPILGKPAADEVRRLEKYDNTPKGELDHA
jgi:hypothetical protein